MNIQQKKLHRILQTKRLLAKDNNHTLKRKGGTDEQQPQQQQQEQQRDDDDDNNELSLIDSKINNKSLEGKNVSEIVVTTTTKTKEDERSKQEHSQQEQQLLQKIVNDTNHQEEEYWKTKKERQKSIAAKWKPKIHPVSPVSPSSPGTNKERSNNNNHNNDNKGSLHKTKLRRKQRSWFRRYLILGLGFIAFVVLAFVSEFARLQLRSFIETTITTTTTINTTLPVFSFQWQPTPPQCIKPNINCPFIFFHQRKAGGSTVRTDIASAAKAMQQPIYIPCITHKLECEVYRTPQSSSYRPKPTVYGGHFFYSTWPKTQYLYHNGKASKKAVVQPRSIEHKFTCLTIFREPVSRIESCWNYRMVQEDETSKSIPLSQLAAKTTTNTGGSNNSTAASLFEETLTSARSMHGEGCLNEPMRIFSDMGMNEDRINRLHELPELIAQDVVQQTLERSSQCVVGILERCEDTKAVIDKYLPFLSNHFLCQPNHKLNEGKVQKGELPEEHFKVIQNLARYETQVYEQANIMLDRILATITTTTTSTTSTENNNPNPTRTITATGTATTTDKNNNKNKNDYTDNGKYTNKYSKYYQQNQT